MMASLYGAAGLFEILGRQDRSGDPAVYELFETAPYRGLQAIDFEPLAQLFADAWREIEAVRDDGRAPGEAAGRIFELIAASGLAPAPWKLADPDHRWAGTLTLLPTVRLVAWGRYRSPAAVRRHYFIVGRSGGLLGDLRRLGSSELRRAGSTVAGVMRDALTSWNEDWRGNGGRV